MITNLLEVSSFMNSFYILLESRKQNSHFCENKYYFADLLNVIVHSLFILLKSRQQKNITGENENIFWGKFIKYHRSFIYFPYSYGCKVESKNIHNFVIMNNIKLFFLQIE